MNKQKKTFEIKISHHWALSRSVNRTIVAATLSPRNVHRMCRDQIGLKPISFGPDANQRRKLKLFKSISFGPDANQRGKLKLLKSVSFGPDAKKGGGPKADRHILDFIENGFLSLFFFKSFPQLRLILIENMIFLTVLSLFPLEDLFAFS